MTAEIQKKYDLKKKRMYDAIDLKEPDRVPIDIEGGKFMINYAGYKMKDAIYDTSLEIYREAATKFQKDFDPDMVSTCGANYYGEGPAYELLRSNITVLAGMPGNKIDEDSLHQYIEFPTLLDDEFDRFFTDRSGWMLNKFLPRVAGVFEPFSSLSFNPSHRAMSVLAQQFAKPEMRQAIETLWKVAELYNERDKKFAAINKELEEQGYPSFYCGVTAPGFDSYSDNLRGTILSLEDLYIREDEILKYSEEFHANQLKMIRNMNKDGSKDGKFIQMMLHKGIDGFMSDEHYEKFYWKDLSELIQVIHENNMVPCMFAEGKYNTRLKFLKQGHKGRTIYRFETIDMVQAKKDLAGVACLSGGFPSPMLEFGTKQQVIDAAKKLLDEAMPGGGYIFRCSAGVDGAKVENLEALFQTVREYGKY